MVAENGFKRLDPTLSRMSWNGMAVDFIHTSAGLMRVGSMPDISKFCRRYGITADWVLVPPWQGSMAGDNYTGEEFILWDAQVSQGPGKTYVGPSTDMAVMYGNLDHTFSWFFDDDCLKVVSKPWLDRWFLRQVADSDFRIQDVSISFKRGNIRVVDRDCLVYDRRENSRSGAGDRAVETVLAAVRPDNRLRRDMEIIPVGIGNGFTGTVASCLVGYGTRVIWIDPGGYPAHTLARIGVHWDEVTDIFISHNHEDHVQGFSAALFRARKKARPLHLITAPSIFKVLRQQFIALCPDFDALVRFTPVRPGRVLELDGMEILTRWNHHILPHGTLGLKITAGGRTFGFSGDTKLDETINARLGRQELLPQWFGGCDLVFHEVSFDHPLGVHTYWKEVKKLGDILDCPVLGYHTDQKVDRPIPLAEEGKTYCLD